MFLYSFIIIHQGYIFADKQKEFYYPLSLHTMKEKYKSTVNTSLGQLLGKLHGAGPVNKIVSRVIIHWHFYRSIEFCNKKRFLLDLIKYSPTILQMRSLIFLEWFYHTLKCKYIIKESAAFQRDCVGKDQGSINFLECLGDRWNSGSFAFPTKPPPLSTIGQVIMTKWENAMGEQRMCLCGREEWI